MATVTTETGTRTIGHGDTVVDFRGTEWIFSRVTRAAEAGRSAKVLVVDPDSDQQREFYASVFPGLEA